MKQLATVLNDSELARLKAQASSLHISRTACLVLLIQRPPTFPAQYERLPGTGAHRWQCRVADAVHGQLFKLAVHHSMSMAEMLRWLIALSDSA